MLVRLGRFRGYKTHLFRLRIQIHPYLRKFFACNRVFLDAVYRKQVPVAEVLTSRRV